MINNINLKKFFLSFDFLSFFVFFFGEDLTLLSPITASRLVFQSAEIMSVVDHDDYDHIVVVVVMVVVVMVVVVMVVVAGTSGCCESAIAIFSASASSMPPFVYADVIMCTNGNCSSEYITVVVFA